MELVNLALSGSNYATKRRLKNISYQYLFYRYVKKISARLLTKKWLSALLFTEKCITDFWQIRNKSDECDPIAFELITEAARKRSMSKTKNGVCDSKYKTASMQIANSEKREKEYQKLEKSILQ